MKKVTINVELSLDEQLSRVYEAFWEQFERPDGMREIWPREVFSEVVIASNGTQLLAYPWTADAEGVITFGTPKVVEVVYQDVETGAAVIGNSSQARPSLVRQAINHLVAALSGSATTKPIEGEEEESGEETETDEPEATAGDPPPTNDDPAEDGEGDEIVPNQFVEMIERLGGVEAVERDIVALRANNTAARQQRIARLTANERCAFTAEELAPWSDDALDKLERSLVPTDYSGRAVPRPNVQEPDEEVLEMPAIPSRNNGAAVK